MSKKRTKSKKSEQNEEKFLYEVGGTKSTALYPVFKPASLPDFQKRRSHRRRQRFKMAALQARIADARKDFLDKTTTDLVATGGWRERLLMPASENSGECFTSASGVCANCA
jgi:hypothetical protein